MGQTRKSEMITQNTIDGSKMQVTIKTSKNILNAKEVTPGRADLFNYYNSTIHNSEGLFGQTKRHSIAVTHGNSPILGGLRSKYSDRTDN